LIRQIAFAQAALLLSSATGQETLHYWPLDAPSLKQWRKKENCTLAHVPGERGGALRWTTRFGKFSFGWTTHFVPEKLDFSQAGSVTFWVKGDGSRGFLKFQLGVTEPGKRSTYYINQADGVTLDFEGWRQITASMARFSLPVRRDVAADMKRIAFIQFVVERKGAGPSVGLMLDDIRVWKAAGDEAAAIRELWNTHARLFRGPPVRDGSNLLPNPSFETDLYRDGQPDFWRGGDWNTGSRFAWDRSLAHDGKASVRIRCESDKQRGSYSFTRTIHSGCWVFEGWYRTQGIERVPKRGVDARLTIRNEKGRHCATVHAYGEPTAGKWQCVRQRFDLPVGSTRVDTTLFNFFAKGTVWWDDVSLRYDLERAKLLEEQRRVEKQRTKEAAAMMDDIARKVEALPDKASEDKLKKAALAWAIEDAQAAVEAGLGTLAKELLGDVQRALDRDIGRRHDPPEHLLLPVLAFDSNPYVQGLLGKIRMLVRRQEQFKKGDEGYQQISNAWRFRSLGDEAYVAAWAGCHPQSPFAGNPKLLAQVLRTLQAIFQNHQNGDFNPGREAVHGYDPNINRFTFVPAFEAYLLLSATYPELILPCKRREWLESARVGTEYQIETYGDTDIRYPNMDVHYMLMMELAARMLGEDRYHREAERFLKGTAECLYPEGAFTYHGYQNECYVYHQINVAHLARYWQLTGSELAHEIVVKSRPYYPNNVEPGGVPEYYTDCFWKHYWGGCSPIGPEIVAGITGCPHNKRIANHELTFAKPNHYYAIYAATLYRDIQDEPLPDGYIRYDCDVEGPRGRFGRFSFAGTARAFPSGHQGKDTFVGGMVVDEPARRFPLNAALQVVTNQYRLAPGGQRWRTCRYLSQDEQNAVAIGNGFAALTTYYRIQNVAWGGKSTLTDWAGNQQWILTPHRLVGVLEIETLSDQQAYSVHGRVRFGMKKDIERKDDTFFKYGALLCRLHEHSYADVITEKSETFYIDPPERFRSTEIVLRDARSVESGEKEPLTYAKGTRHFFTVEVFPYWSTLAESVTRVSSESGLRGLETCADGRHVLLMHNPTSSALIYEARLPWARGALSLHRSGARSPAPEPLAAEDGRIRIEVPAHSHVVVEKQQ